MLTQGNPQKNIDPDGKEPITVAAVLGIIGYATDIIVFSYYSVQYVFEDDPLKQREYAAEALITGYLASDAIPFNTLVVPGSKAGYGVLSRISAFKSMFPKIKKLVKPALDIGSINEAINIIGNNPSATQNINPINPSSQASPAKEAQPQSISYSVGSYRSSSAGTNTLGSNTPQQVIAAAGGSTLKTSEQRAASEALAASIIAKQRAAATKKSSGSG